MLGRLRDLTMNRDGSQNVTLTVSGDFRQRFDELQGVDLDVEIKRHRERRSLSANAYFHVLVNKIAAAVGSSMDTIKTQLVMDYGVVDKDANGNVYGFKLLNTLDVSRVSEYAKWYGTSVENGRTFNLYLVMKPTHEMDTLEMSRLIDGTIAEAKELGIETDTPATLERLKSEWEKQERKMNHEKEIAQGNHQG